jgi:hypothetical protein
VTESEFESLLDEDPTNREIRIWYSDYLESQGDLIRSKGQRWMVQEEVFPAKELILGEDQIITSWAWPEIIIHGVRMSPGIKLFKSRKIIEIILAKILDGSGLFLYYNYLIEDSSEQDTMRIPDDHI